MRKSLHTMAAAAMLAFPALGQVTAVAPRVGALHRSLLDGWAGRNPISRKVKSRYSPDELAAFRAKRAKRVAARAKLSLHADFLNPCVTDTQMLERHSDWSLVNPVM